MTLRRAKKARGATRNGAGGTAALRGAHLRYAGMILALAAVAGGSAWGVMRLTDPATLPIRAVQIEGTFRHLDAEALRAAVAPHVGGGFFTVDVEAVRRAVQALPWVDRASVRRVWPDKLRIRVVEQVPLARWGDDGVVNVRGEVVHVPPSSIPADLPVLRGPDGQAARMAARYRAMARTLAAAGTAIAALILDERHAWRVVLTNGIELKLGRRDAGRRLARFVQVYPRLLAAEADAIRRVDLRYTNGFAVRWRRAAADGRGTAGG